METERSGCTRIRFTKPDKDGNVQQYLVKPNSTNPYQLTEADRTVIGNTTPKFSGVFGLNATYKGFDMSMFFNFMYDFDVLNANKIMLTTWADNKENNSYR